MTKGSVATDTRCQEMQARGNRGLFSHRHVATALIALALFGCGGGNDETPAGSAATQSSSGSASGSAQTGAGQGDAKRIMGTDATNSSAAILSKMGKSGRVQIGLGSGQSIDDMKAQGIRPDIVDTYLVGTGPGAWNSWNSPDGAFLTYRAQAAISYGATPMFTLYQMQQRGDGNLSGINDASFMSDYWSQVRTMYDRINDLNTAVLVNLEPDFWPYVYAQAPNHDATQMPAVVNNQPECSWMANNAANIGSCLVSMARWHAPKALIGFPRHSGMPRQTWLQSKCSSSERIEPISSLRRRATAMPAASKSHRWMSARAVLVRFTWTRTTSIRPISTYSRTPTRLIVTHWAMGFLFFGGRHRWGYLPTRLAAHRGTSGTTMLTTCCATRGSTEACIPLPLCSAAGAPIRQTSTRMEASLRASSVNI